MAPISSAAESTRVIEHYANVGLANIDDIPNCLRKEVSTPEALRTAFQNCVVDVVVYFPEKEDALPQDFEIVSGNLDFDDFSSRSVMQSKCWRRVIVNITSV